MKIRRELEGMEVSEEADEKLMRLGELGELKAPELPKVDEYDERLRELHAKTASAREMRENQARQVSRRMATDQESYRGLGTGLQLFYVIVGLPLFAFGIGWLLDRALGGSAWKPLLTIAGAAVGVGYAIVTLNRTNK